MAQFLKMACLVLLPLVAVGLGLLAMFWAGERYGGDGVLLVLAVVLVAWLIAIPWFGAVHGSRAMGGIFLAMFFQCGGCLATFVPLSGHFVRESPTQQWCTGNLKRIGMALEAYRVQYGSLPPAFVTDASGKPLYSWRVLILPYLEQQAMYDVFARNEAWDSPRNQNPSRISMQEFGCPKVRRISAEKTSYVAIAGPNTAWPGAVGSKLEQLPHATAETILVVELDESDIGWSEPRDLDIRDLLGESGGRRPSSRHYQRQFFARPAFNALFADGSVRFLDWERVRALLGPDGTGAIVPAKCEIVVPTNESM